MAADAVPSPDRVAKHRQRIWTELVKVARPDSRFHWDFSSFIPDFEGSEACATRVAELDAWDAGGLLFVTPDNSTEAVRRLAIRSGRPLLMTTYGIQRGFLRLDPGIVPPEEHSYAATLDGMDRWATPVSLLELRQGPRVGLLVTGGSAVSVHGVRFGKGHGYFDLEWALLSEIGAVTADAEIVDVVHDCQVVDDQLPAEDHDVAVDWIVTPTRTLAADRPERPAGRVRWELLADSPLAGIPPVQELRTWKS